MTEKGTEGKTDCFICSPLSTTPRNSIGNSPNIFYYLGDVC